MTKAVPGNFMDWVRDQHRRKDDVGDLARKVRDDRRASSITSAADLSRRLNEDQADWQMHDALEQAEAEWRREAGL